MAIGIGSALLGKGENDKDPAHAQLDPPQQPAPRSSWTLGSLIPKTDMKTLLQMPANTVPWNMEPTRFSLLQKICSRHGLARQGELKDLEHRIKAGLHWNDSQLQTNLQSLYFQQMKAGAMNSMRLGAAAFVGATSTAAQPVLLPFAPLFTTPAPDPFEGHRDTLLRRLNVRNGFPESGNTKKLTYQLQRNLGWDDQQLKAKLEIEYHCQKNNTWMPSPKDKAKDEGKETDAEKVARADAPQAEGTEDPQWEYLSSVKNSSGKDDDEHLEQKESQAQNSSEAATESEPSEPSEPGSKSEPCGIRHRELQRTFSGSSDSSYEVVDGM